MIQNQHFPFALGLVAAAGAAPQTSFLHDRLHGRATESKGSRVSRVAQDLVDPAQRRGLPVDFQPTTVSHRVRQLQLLFPQPEQRLARTAQLANPGV